MYGTEDPFYRQFEEQYEVIKNMGTLKDICMTYGKNKENKTRKIVLNNWPHGFGSDGGWVKDYAQWMEEIFLSDSSTLGTRNGKDGREGFTPETRVQDVSSMFSANNFSPRRPMIVW